MIKYLKKIWQNYKLKYSVKKTAKHLSGGSICLFPSQGVYTLIVNGNNLEVVQKLRKAKGRDLNKREGLLSPPERLFDFIDFSLLSRINSQISKNTIINLYEANPVGLVLPCKKGVIPEYLITYQETKIGRIPTLMNIWNSKYKIYQLFWKELCDYPEVLWIGSSANLTNNPPLNYKDACRVFSNVLSHTLEDPGLEYHSFKGSYTMISLIDNPPKVLRKGSIHPEEHPDEFQKFKEVLPELIVP
jgi:tRNA A37 threonylcarbamoyladenosine synthetase subunit TsaC/SUA5/YrdC